MQRFGNVGDSRPAFTASGTASFDPGRLVNTRSRPVSSHTASRKPSRLHAELPPAPVDPEAYRAIARECGMGVVGEPLGVSDPLWGP